MEKIKSFQLWESEESEKKLAEKDMQKAIEWAKKYGYEIDTSLGVDVVIRKLVERHNTFLRGIKSAKDIQKWAIAVPPTDAADVQLGDADLLTRDGELGILFTTNRWEDASGYGHVAIVRRHINLNGPRSGWLEKNDFEVLEFNKDNEEELLKKFNEVDKEEDHLIFKSPWGDYGIVHYLFRGEPEEILLDFIGMAESSDVDNKLSKR